MDPIFLDTETTGNMPGKDRLCSIAYKVNGEIRDELYKPPGLISIDAMAVHHITNEMVEKKPAFTDSPEHKELTKILKDNILVAHNAPFDIAMLEAEGIATPQYICTLRVARSLDTEGKIPRFSLQYLRYLLKIDIPTAEAHSAAGDILVLEALFDRLKEKASLDEMVKISQQPALLHRINFGKHRGKHLKEIVATDRGYLEWLLSEKMKTPNDPNEEDWIYSLKHYLAA